MTNKSFSCFIISRLLSRVNRELKKMELHEKLKYLRTNKKLTQKNVAVRVSLNVRQYQRYESGEQIPTATVLSRLCHFFKVPSGYFLDNDVQEKEKTFDNLFTPSGYFDLLKETYIMEQKIFETMEFDKIFECNNDFIQKLNEIEKKIHELQKQIESLKKFN